MRKLITILMLCGSAVFGATNYFTDVTIEGTPYLTTNVMHEISVMSQAIGDIFGFIADPDLNEGDYASRRLLGFGSLVYHVRMIMTEYVKFPTYLDYRIFPLYEVPTNAFIREDIYYDDAKEFLIAAGFSERGWRTATNYNPAVNDWRDWDDPMYGTATNWSVYLIDGEILGPWIVDDLQIALSTLKAVGYRNPLTGGAIKNQKWESTNRQLVYDSDSRYTNNWVGAKSLAESEFTGGGSVATNLVHTGPIVLTSGSLSGWPTLDDYGAGIFTGEWVIRLYGDRTNTPSMLYGGNIHFAAYAEGPFGYTTTGNVFDANGYTVVNTNWSIFSVKTVPSGTTNVYSDTIGSMYIPTWVDEPTSTNVAVTVRKGFSASDTTIVIQEPDWPYTRE